MENDIKERVVLYNVNKEKRNLIKKIFLELNIDVNLIDAENEEAVIASNLVSFIKLPKDKEKRDDLEDIYISSLKGWMLFYIIDDNFYKNIEQIKMQIKECHDDYIKTKRKDNLNNVRDGIIGFAIGDALGVSAKFKTREELKKTPITDMIGNGTWSENTSMTLATIYSIIKKEKIDTNVNINNSKKYEQLGEMNNENVLLMKMLPIAYYIYFGKLNDYLKENYCEMIYNYIKDILSITNANEINILGCYIFVMFAIEIIQGKLKDLSYEYIKNLDYSFFSRESIKKYDRILKGNIKEELEENIRTTGYIVDTLEAVFWCFLNSKDYNETVLKSVNLGGDTDTIAAITGGLLSIHYGIKSINKDWRNNLIKYDYIEKLCDQFYNELYKIFDNILKKL